MFGIKLKDYCKINANIKVTRDKTHDKVTYSIFYANDRSHDVGEFNKTLNKTCIPCLVSYQTYQTIFLCEIKLHFLK